ncbi:MAG: aminoacyl-tRNA hydrolase [Proteobacteria bacterium]|nr:aminoacyl-tRNA hydrolase [Pseudomonadota bacterium]MBU1741033.1 aminoacyl-tRNA hydrolase [Pseudomonadota bacterium]
MIGITPTIELDERELEFDFVRASGPGGQNVNKVATAVQLRFDAANSPSLAEDVRRRLVVLGGKRVNREGVLIIDARRQRTQERNRQEAIDRLVELIRRAATPPKKRRPTAPSAAARQRRLRQKRRRADIKRLRRTDGLSED